jgi:hypothetical protein
MVTFGPMAQATLIHVKICVNDLHGIHRIEEAKEAKRL